MPRLLKTLPLLLLAALVLVACDAGTPGGGGNNCPFAGAPSANEVSGSVCDYDATEHGTQAFAFATPKMFSRPSNLDLDAYQERGELSSAGVFTIDLPETMPAIRTEVCMVAPETPLLLGPVVENVHLFRSDVSSPYRDIDKSYVGELRGLRHGPGAQVINERQLWIFNETGARQEIETLCPAAVNSQPIDVDLTLEPGWNLALLSLFADPTERATITNGTVSNTSMWGFFPGYQALAIHPQPTN